MRSISNEFREISCLSFLTRESLLDSRSRPVPGGLLAKRKRGGGGGGFARCGLGGTDGRTDGGVGGGREGKGGGSRGRGRGLHALR